jgi:subtilase family serine protease
MEIELAKMAVRGLTVVAGSGDAGASNVGGMAFDDFALISFALYNLISGSIF